MGYCILNASIGFTWELSVVSHVLSFAAHSPRPSLTRSAPSARLEIELIEMEIRHAAAYVNDAVIPQVRRESITAMRTVADTLRNFADKLDNQTARQQPTPPPSGPPRP